MSDRHIDTEDAGTDPKVEPGAQASSLDQEVGENGLLEASQWQLMWIRFRKNRAANVAAVVLGILYIAAAFAGFVAPYDPQTKDVDRIYAPPQRIRIFHEGSLHRPFVYGLIGSLDPETFVRSYEIDRSRVYPVTFFARTDPYEFWGLFDTDVHLIASEGEERMHLLGTDNLGRDLFSRIVYGARISLSIGLVGVFLSIVIGLTVGSISGYFGGRVDNLIQRGMEILRSFPRIPLWMALTAALPQDWTMVQVYLGITVILSLLGWTNLARVARGKVLSIKNEDFVMAAELVGASRARIMFRHLVPSFLSHTIAATTLAIPGMILGETSLSFLGLGLRPPAISWGVLLSTAQNIHTLAAAPWIMYPGLFVIVTVLAFSFLGDGIRDAADPYQQ